MSRRRPRAPIPQAFPPLRLVYDRDRDDSGQEQERSSPDTIANQDTIAALQKLLNDARKGELVGLAYTALYAHRAYCVKATDDLRENPTFARGCVAALDDELRRLVEATS